MTKLAMYLGVHRQASQPTAASGSFCTVTPHSSTPCALYAERKAEKYLAHARCIDGIRQLGDAERSIDCWPPTGSFIQAGGDHGEA